jgi:multidrug efflux pump subunit AcrA (membrane-fusion protein)
LDQEIKEGDLVMAGTQLVAISQKKDFIITIPNEAGYSGVNLRYNMEVKIGVGSSMNALEAEMKGRIISAPNFLQSGTQPMLYVKAIDPPEGMNWDKNVYVEFERVKLENALMVPYSAVSMELDAYLDDNNKFYVMVMEEGVKRKRYIVSDRQNGDYYLVLDGLEEGCEVVVN